MGTTVTPPDNFALVSKGVYRSSFPTKKNFTFVSRLGLRSVLYLCPEDYPESHLAFYAQHGIQLLQFGTTGNKEPFDEIPQSIVRNALLAILDPTNRPLLIHCNQGKHRTGCLVGCLRKTQRWSLVSIFDEYRRFAGIKSRVHDEQYIERFPVRLCARPAFPLSLWRRSPRPIALCSQAHPELHRRAPTGFASPRRPPPRHRPAWPHR